MPSAQHPRSPVQQDATSRNNISSQRDAIRRYLRNRNELTQRQRNAVELLLRGLSDQEVAGQIGVDRSTIFRWRASLLFQREMDRQRRMLWERSALEIQAMVSPALDILRRQLTSADERLATRAAAVIMRFATPSRLIPSGPHKVPTDLDEQKRLGDDLIAYVDAPPPGQPGGPKDLDDEDADP